MIKISHDGSFCGKIFAALFKPTFWETSIDHDDVRLTRWAGGNVTIPWHQVTCLDLAGLTPRSGTVKASRPFFLLMINDPQLVLNACTYSSHHKTWLAATNVLGITRIKSDDLAEVHNELVNLAKINSIKLDAIFLPD